MPKDQVEEIPEPIVGLRSGLLHEGIFFLHKSAHVLGSSLVHVSAGMCTWSLSSAYQSAFFAMRSISSMLGVTVVETGDRHFLLDVWGSPQKPRRGMRWPIIVLASTGKNQQRNLWAYFQRAIEKTSNLDEVISNALRSSVLQCDYGDFGKQRNELHYRTKAWDLGDLHQCVLNQNFGVIGGAQIDTSQQDYSLGLAFGLFATAHKMLSAISADSGVVEPELRLIDSWLMQPFNQLYHQNLPAFAVV